MPVVGLLTVSDGRASVHRGAGVGAFARTVEDRVAAALERLGHRVVRASEPVWTSELAVREARTIAAAAPSATIVNIPVWAFPHFTALAASELRGALVLFSNLNPQYPGMVGMLAAAGELDQVGRRHERIWGEIEDAAVLARIDAAIRAGDAVRSLRGATFGRIGGRPMGMYTAVANTDQWMRQFGVDVEEIDQWELVRRSATIEPSRARAGREWLERHAAGVHYDGSLLTPELLERQVRSYHALRELADEWNLAFCGVKGQPELTDSFCTMDVAEAFMNDPYDWEGPKEAIVCATEADMDGALTMQILKRLA